MAIIHADDPVRAELRATFGFDGFRPLQDEVVRAILGGRDVFVLMPTGGGKSLCYQLPALLSERLAVVVSPLIALMKDQVDKLSAMGVAATFVNSSLDGAEV
ncbi:MAG: DEAD/DEAH box helicase, partial [Chloroflexi bacterium]|nr:DEAD/DEAH box helicase [Chloroflexota bacterium]